MKPVFSRSLKYKLVIASTAYKSLLSLQPPTVLLISLAALTTHSAMGVLIKW